MNNRQTSQMQNLIDLVVSYGDLSLHWVHIPFFLLYTDLYDLPFGKHTNIYINAHDYKSTNSVNFTVYTSVFVHFF